MYYFGILVLLASCNGVPVYSDLELESNSVDGDLDGLDLSHLGPEAYVEPSNKTGELDFLVQNFPLSHIKIVYLLYKYIS